MAGFGAGPSSAPARQFAGVKRKADQIGGDGADPDAGANANAGRSTRTSRSFVNNTIINMDDDNGDEYEILSERPKHLDQTADVGSLPSEDGDPEYAPGPSNAALGARKCPRKPHRESARAQRALPAAGKLTGRALAAPALRRTISNASNGSSASCEGMPALPNPSVRRARQGRLANPAFASGQDTVILLSDSDEEDPNVATAPGRTMTLPSRGKAGRGSGIVPTNAKAEAGPSRIGAANAAESERAPPVVTARGRASKTPERQVETPAEPAKPLDAASAALARILEIIPDADPTWVLTKVRAILPPPLPAPAADAAAPGTSAVRFQGAPEPPANPFPGTEASTDPVERVLAEAFEKGYEKAKLSAEGSRKGPGGSGSGSGSMRGNKRKRKAQGPGAAEMYKSKEYRKARRSGRFYVPQVKDYLEGYFDMIPLPYIRGIIRANDNLLVPSYYAIRMQSQKPIGERGFNQLKAGRKGKARAANYDEDAHMAKMLASMDSDDSDDDTEHDDNDDHNDKRQRTGDEDDDNDGTGKRKGKVKEAPNAMELGVMEFLREKRWLLETLGKFDVLPTCLHKQVIALRSRRITIALKREFSVLIMADNEKRQEQETAAKAAAKELALAEGNGMECPVCCEEELVEDMAQCQDGHLFCKSCARRQAEYTLGDQKHEILCIGSTDCKMPILDSSLYSCISYKLIELYERLKQQAELQAAGLEGLESCPECSYAAIIENPHERLFRCENEECRRVSCRGCWKVEHLPKTCKEAEAEKHLDKRHAIEDAMSDALIRTCPKASCKTKYLKEDGCNKMICPKCRTIQCYVCRKMIPDGYNHFEKNMIDPDNPRVVSKCLLWEKTADRDQQAIIAARDAARLVQEAALAADGHAPPDKILDVEAPPAPPAPAGLPGGGLAPARMPPLPIPGVPQVQGVHGHLAAQQMVAARAQAEAQMVAARAQAEGQMEEMHRRHRAARQREAAAAGAAHAAVGGMRAVAAGVAVGPIAGAAAAANPPPPGPFFFGGPRAAAAPAPAAQQHPFIFLPLPGVRRVHFDQG